MSEKKTEWSVKVSIGWVAIVMLLAAVVLISHLSCRTTTDPDVVSGAGHRVVNCAAKAVGDNWTRAYPEVMKCLTVVLINPTECLDAVPSVVKATVDTVACIVRDTAKTAGMAAKDPDADAVTVRKAERSREYLERRGFEFAE